MKKKLAFFVALSVFSMFALENAVAANLSLEAQFAKANITEKTYLIKKSSGSETENLSELGIKFVIENVEILPNDRDLCALALASVVALPQDVALDKNFYLADSLMTIFNSFTDDALRIAVLDRLLDENQKIKRNSAIVNFINSYLRSTIERKERVTEVTRRALKSAGEIGNRETFRIVFNGWKLQTWRAFQEIAEDTLVLLASSNISEVVKVFAMSNSKDDLDFYEIIEKNSKISQEFKAEVAENALSDTILSIENFDEVSAEQVLLQQKALKIISDNNRTRASVLVLRTFSLSKEEYARNIITPEQFVMVIEATSRLSAPETAFTFSKYLESLNSGMEKGSAPEKAVVLSIIKSLGELGDKVAFDSLLYVTYLPYPEDVIVATRNSLAKLKW